MDINSVPPGLSPDAMAVALAGLQPPPPAVSATEPAPAARWLTDKPRVTHYDLEYPFAIDDVEYKVITLKRLIAGEVAAFVDRMRSDPAKEWRFPLFFHGDHELSDAAWEALDDDDRFALEEISTGFLPARFRRRTAAAA